MKINYDPPGPPIIEPTYRASELIQTLDVLAARLYRNDHEAHARRIKEIRRFLQAHYGTAAGLRALDVTLIDFGAMCFQAGICETTGEPYETGNARADAALIQIKARLARKPEGGQG